MAKCADTYFTFKECHDFFFKVQVLVHIVFFVVVTIHCMHLLVRAGQIMTLLTESEYLDYAEVVDSAMQSSNRLQKYRGVAK